MDNKKTRAGFACLPARWLCCVLVLAVLCGSCGTAAAQSPAAVMDYHRTSAIMRNTYGERVIAMACETIDAFLAGESSVILHGVEEDDLAQITRCLGTMCPLFVAFTYFDVDCFDAQTGRLSWINFCTPEQITEKHALLQQTVADFLQPLQADDGDLIKAADLYYRYASVNTYQDALTDPGTADAQSLAEMIYAGSPYQALVEHTAICYGLSDGLAFLYVQAGLDAVTVGCFTSDTGGPAHDWVMVQLDGSYFYVDPTWDMPYGADHAGLLYFGMTAADRYAAGGYALERTELYGNDDSFDMTAFGLQDDRFRILREERFRQVQSLTIDHENQCIIIQAADDTTITLTN